MNRDDFLSMLKPGEGYWVGRDFGVTAGSIHVGISDVIDMLEGYKSGDVSYEQLLDWANLVMFNDAFDYEGDEIGDALERIEESDESGNELTTEDVASLISSLRRK